MNFLFSIAFGVLTYYGLFDIVNLSDGFSTAAGWVVGLGILLGLDLLEKQTKHRNEMERLRVNNELQYFKKNKQQENTSEKEHNASHFDFFKTKK